MSFYQPQPFYQTGVVPAICISKVTFSAHPASRYTSILDAPRRVTPDVAMDADPYSGFLVGETHTISSTAASTTSGCATTTKTTEIANSATGGTSFASPSFAGVLALVNQARAIKGRGDLGFANPLLYKRSRSARPGSNFGRR